MEDSMSLCMRIHALAAATGVGLAILLAQGGAAAAAEVNVMCVTSLRSALDALGPQFERETGHKLAIKFATSAVLKRQIEAGEAFDLALLVPGALDDLIKQGRVVAETRVDISRSPIGVAVRTGAAKPDVSSAEAFKRALASAKTIAFSGEGVSGAHFTGMLEKFGIAEETKPRLRPLPGGAVADAVAKGEAEMAVITIANVLGVPGVELVGLLPAELQHYTVYSGGVGATAKDADAAKALLRLLLAPASNKVIQDAGMERMP
jgi:molybdate transport system substrate-binding protein